MELTITYLFSQIFIIINYIFLVLSYQVKDRKKILIFNFGALISTALSHFFLGAYSGLAMQFVSIIRNIVFLIDENTNNDNEKTTTKDIIILVLLYIVSIIFAIFTYNGFLSLMPVFATMVYTYSVWQKNTKVYKLLGVLVSILWLIYDIYIFSVFAIVLESILLISVIIGLLKEEKK